MSNQRKKRAPLSLTDQRKVDKLCLTWASILLHRHKLEADLLEQEERLATLARTRVKLGVPEALNHRLDLYIAELLREDATFALEHFDAALYPYTGRKEPPKVNFDEHTIAAAEDHALARGVQMLASAMNKDGSIDADACARPVLGVIMARRRLGRVHAAWEDLRSEKNQPGVVWNEIVANMRSRLYKNEIEQVKLRKRSFPNRTRAMTLLAVLCERGFRTIEEACLRDSKRKHRATMAK